jgi:CBS domain-containing protein
MIAGDIMTRKVHTIHPEATVREAAQLLFGQRISGAPVVNTDGAIVGIVTEADITSKVGLDANNVDQRSLRVVDIMTREIIAVEEDTPVHEIAKLLTERRIKRVPVVRDGKPVGIISRADIVHAVAEGHLLLRDW